MKVRLRLDGREHDVELTEGDDGWHADVDGTSIAFSVERKGTSLHARSGGHAVHAEVRQGTLVLDGHPADQRILALEGVAGAGAGAAGDGAVRPPMTGKVVRVDVQEGDSVEAGQVLFILEAMKMQNEVKSPVAGVVAEVGAAAGEAVETDRVVVRITPA